MNGLTSNPLNISPESPAPLDSSPWEETIDRYFESLSAGDFTTTASLFSVEGILHPPFDRSVVGSVAILAYLTKEATGIRLESLGKTATEMEKGGYQYDAIGKVHTALFSVNVSWIFHLNARAEIESVKVKLLATFQELLVLKQ